MRNKDLHLIFETFSSYQQFLPPKTWWDKDQGMIGSVTYSAILIVFKSPGGLTESDWDKDTNQLILCIRWAPMTLSPL
jgi:hypothetical protein